MNGPADSPDAELLRFTTAGSVDDGKSTLIGRLLCDTKAVMDDQLEAVQRASEQRGEEQVNLALLTDGLRAEREQSITIDVAYRYFATPRRKFIIADTPGHLQYTRNMVTGASTANLALVLVDARKGILEQTRRHALLASLLRIPHLVLCVNKMDLVDYRPEVFDALVAEFKGFASRLEVADVQFIPISALRGDNVVERSPRMPWYAGNPLLYALETVYLGGDHNHIDARFAVQWVVRPNSADHHDFRGFSGRVLGGVFKPGDEVKVLPSGRASRIKSLHALGAPRPEAFAPMNALLMLEDEIDISRGDMLVKPHNAPETGRDLEVMLCWFDEKKLQPGGKYLVRHTTREVRGVIREVRYKLDVNTLHKAPDTGEIGMNDIARVHLRVSAPLFFDAYQRNRSTGSLILIDEFTHATAAAGMIL